MMYEKVTGKVLSEDQIIGVRLFGPYKTKKVTNLDQFNVNHDNGFPIISVTQRTLGSVLPSFDYLLKKVEK